MSTKQEKKVRNPIAVAMMLRYGRTTTTMGDRRMKRQNRRSWRKDQEV